jgi:hypothetical protein
MTFAQVALGTGGTTATSLTQIGSDITLPAGGPWKIHGVYCQAIQDTAVASEAVAGYLYVDSKSGDINPDPAPGHYPVNGVQAAQGANLPLRGTGLNIYPVNWEAAGKAVVSLSFYNLSGNATAPRILAGIIYSDAIPEKRPLTFVDSVQLNCTAAGATALGSITLAEKATRLVGICPVLYKDGALTADEGILAYAYIDSADVKLTPGQFPFNTALSAGDGTPAGGATTPPLDFITLDQPVVGGAIVNCTAYLDQAVTAGVDAYVFLAYE